MKKIYALYKGDNLLIMGTIDEIAKSQNVKKETILFYGTNTYLKRHENSRSGNYKVLVRLDDDNENTK